MKTGKNKNKKPFFPFYRVVLSREEIKAVADTVKSGWLTTGYRVQEFEQHFASFVDVKYAIAVSSCTAALQLALQAHGIGAGDEVLVPSFTFVSTVNVILHIGAKPVFVDIEPETYNISVTDIRRKITKKTKAIIVVHYAGLPVELNKINSIAKQNGIIVIEDAAHAAGSKYLGKYIGSYGNTTCFSFYATKNITTGEGGMLTTNNAKIADFVLRNRMHGISKDAWKRYIKGGSWKYDVVFPGYKYNMTDVQAVLGIKQLEKLEKNNKKRNLLANLYNDLLSGNKFVQLPIVTDNSYHSRHLYPILIHDYNRDTFIEYMKEQGVGLSVHFIPVHQFSFYKKHYPVKKGDLFITTEVGKKIVSLPLFPSMTEDNVRMIVGLIDKYFKKK